MAGLRAILGGLEAGLFPGSVYLLSTWYPRYELQKRNATFFLIGSVASGFGGILAYGLSQMDGLGGISGWQWIFIVGFSGFSEDCRRSDYHERSCTNNSWKTDRRPSYVCPRPRLLHFAGRLPGKSSEVLEISQPSRSLIYHHDNRT